MSKHATPPPVPPMFYRPTEVAQAIGTSVRTVKARMADGTIPSTTVGRCRLVPAAWLHDLEAQAHKGAA